MTAVSIFALPGVFALRSLDPTFGRPTALTYRSGREEPGAGALSLGSRKGPWYEAARRFRSRGGQIQGRNRKVPLAQRIGFRRRNAPIFTLRSTAPAEAQLRAKAYTKPLQSQRTIYGSPVSSLPTFAGYRGRMVDSPPAIDVRRLKSYLPNAE